ncbi:undecaprenyldiphospho-muramoylpentapeptide beta-N-acetylglucosaminyltransferase [Tepidibacillus sp. HK-1]|uniref:undecaprenyldiphospho-muramoylpentapeptide beta-N-acetylglucosaminyltransferase n=1 Tax=Tepidibacillus sp. HK-1 TaxID=1883407 RepID=UPI000852FD5B|nr:undecaprenyldiphospho-muramoylpentapeptide beta-N-acetylglucosaminyltransferase [Tepidibacillus sp. HK-1]GBF11978.1 UDP-N-acetylglucosamine--N-acetylmuramyl-(pentapeptide) pyrophosphoryl-undecaprenol N-acetylglucosamine transferase [Tepidibacillus sp. HK-1]
MRVILSGGGTGGHIYPALAMVKEIKKHEPNAEFLYIGSKNGLEKKIVQNAEIPFVEIEISGFKRKLSFENIKTALRFLRGVQKSKKYIQEFRPDLVIGTGGYVCGPVLYAASQKKVRTIIHEQNVIPGLTNQFLSRYVDLVAISFEGAREHFKKAKKIRLTGNPRATEVVHANKENGLKALHLSADKKIILVFGGSRGAKAINQAFLEMLPELHQYPEYHFVFVTGEIHFETINEQLKMVDEQYLSNVSIYPYLYNMPEVLAATDLIVSRAGASSLAEITALGIPSVLIPSPYVTNNHQEKNAKWMEDQGAAKMIREKELNGVHLLSTIRWLMDDERRKKFSHAAKKIGKPDAATNLYQEMMTFMDHKN